jgi:hypothetical protein
MIVGVMSDRVPMGGFSSRLIKMAHTARQVLPGRKDFCCFSWSRFP